MGWQEQVSERMKGVGTNLLSRFVYPTQFRFGATRPLYIFRIKKKGIKNHNWKE